jgi:hypothetical protein
MIETTNYTLVILKLNAFVYMYIFIVRGVRVDTKFKINILTRTVQMKTVKIFLLSQIRKFYFKNRDVLHVKVP